MDAGDITGGGVVFQQLLEQNIPGFVTCHLLASSPFLPSVASGANFNDGHSSVPSVESNQAQQPAKHYSDGSPSPDLATSAHLDVRVEFLSSVFSASFKAAS